jgi:hypothetical protein
VEILGTFDVVEEQSTFERTLIRDIKRQCARFDVDPSPDCELAICPIFHHKSIRIFYRREIATEMDT